MINLSMRPKTESVSSHHLLNLGKKLLDAAKTGDISEVQSLLQSGERNINYKDILLPKQFMKFKLNLFYNISISSHLWNLVKIFNCTPLIWASSKGHAEIVKLLLSQPDIEVNCTTI